jgi:NADH:ubiquinone oxidoreductase subunit K
MQYLDLALSSALFVLGVLSFVVRRLKTNLWISALALLLLPIAVYSYYFTDYDRLLFGKITVQTVLRFTFVKILLVFALAGFMRQRKSAK